MKNLCVFFIQVNILFIFSQHCLANSAEQKKAEDIRQTRLKILLNEKQEVLSIINKSQLENKKDPAVISRMESNLKELDKEISYVKKSLVYPTKIVIENSKTTQKTIQEKTETVPQKRENSKESYASWDVFKNFGQLNGKNHEENQSAESSIISSN